MLMSKQDQVKPMIQELKRKILLYEKILDISADGFLIVNSKGYIVDINRAYCAFLGLKKENIVGRYVMDVIKNSKLPEIMVTGETEVNVLHRLAKGQTPGDEKYVAVSRAAVRDGDEVVGAVGQIYFRKETMELAEKLRNMDSELSYYKRELEKVIRTRYTFENIIGRNKQFLEVKKIAEKAAKNDFTILLFGDTGTGKEVFANAIHYAGVRKYKPLIRVNCSAIPSELLESELFGYEEGAFTGAKKGGKKGKFELANGGTIFLDEIGDMPLNMQAKLLRVLQEKEIEKVGGYKPMPIDVRVIAATNQNLESFGRKKLREDLYYRLNVIQLRIPPLTERPDDIRIIAENFLKRLNQDNSKSVIFSPELYAIIEKYSWPGNVRELKNVIERAYCLVEGDVILPSHLPSHILANSKIHNAGAKKKTLDKIMEEIEREILLNALKKTNYNYKLTAKELGIHRSTLYCKFEKLNIRRNGENIITI
jgi:PAS domain S-box-containing protein